VAGTRPLAVLRGVPLALSSCELTWLERQPIDLDLALAQHTAYKEALVQAGLDVVELPADHALPDSCFVEDLIIDLGEVRILTRPGAVSRRGEREAILQAFAPGGPLADYGPLIDMPEGLRLDGGDVLMVRDRMFVGLSSRTDGGAVAWLAAHGNRPVVGVQVCGALHLKTAVTALTDNALICNPEAVDLRPFLYFDVMQVRPGEEAAANALRLPPRLDHVGPDERDERAFMDAQCVHAIACARRWGVNVIPVDISEFAKAEAGLTCLSVLLRGGM
jgi:dimethylargininase